MSDAEVLDWLRDAGFKQQGDEWLIPEADLGQLDPSEVTSSEVNNVNDGSSKDPHLQVRVNPGWIPRPPR